ncbi:MAG: LysM peptidoglycan-binding domain-containing protein [Chloroflexota bacterium]|nr:LysM peptidoglycan-binding domain-containing protein [Chloroflexota bacterium]
MSSIDWRAFLFLLLTPLFAACTLVESRPVKDLVSPTPTSDSIVMMATRTPTAVPPTQTPLPPTATVTSLPSATPTASPTPVQGRYHVKAGDTLLSIALQHDMTLEELLEYNDIAGEEETIRVGEMLVVPSSIALTLPEAWLTYDSEVVYGRSYLDWDTEAFIKAKGGYLAAYTEWDRSAAEIIDAVSAKYHVGPRVLLAAMELLSGWVSGGPRSQHPFGVKDGGPPNLGWQATFAAKKLMEGYYGQLEGRRDWVILDNGTAARLYPGTNPGTAAVANLLAAVTPSSNFPKLLQSNQFQKTYQRLFGKVEGGPVRPPGNKQPYFELPFPEAELWYFSGGPHGGFGDQISGWAALDFAPPVAMGCWPSVYPVRAVAPGRVIGSEEGQVWVDLDGDHDIRTGWCSYTCI